MKKTIMTTALAVAFGAAPLASHAVITVLSINGGNADGFTATTPSLNTATPAGDKDNLWGFSSTNNQALLGSGDGTGETTSLSGQVWVSRGDNPGGEDNPILTTSISGLDTGTLYNVYGYYLSSNGPSDNWGMQIKLGTDASFTTYTAADGEVLDSSNGGAGTTFSFLRRVYLGQSTLGSSTVDVNFDDIGPGAGTRGFIKGVGIEAVPEPSSAALLGLGGLALILRRRRS
ncbi:hypothetical protein NT6N_37690 [Oceaniferula spumae]|uniref:Ice-binding protein C-terminal domain-containing protein n=1 Tax=Oceaniferula spumae TaxID=2979115 RepID=A0AAT9FS48_9BACT